MSSHDDTPPPPAPEPGDGCVCCRWWGRLPDTTFPSAVSGDVALRMCGPCVDAKFVGGAQHPHPVSPLIGPPRPLWRPLLRPRSLRARWGPW